VDCDHGAFLNDEDKCISIQIIYIDNGSNTGTGTYFGDITFLVYPEHSQRKHLREYSGYAGGQF
jgi:hypothetical protein